MKLGTRRYCGVLRVKTPWNPCFITSIPLESNSKHYYYDILNLIATDSIDMVYNKGLNINLTHQDIKNIYFNLLNKIKQYYEEKIITQDKYLYILGELLYVNTTRIFYKLGRNSVQIKNNHLNNINTTPLYTLFFDSLKRRDENSFGLKDKSFNYGSINELQNSYELYKSVMKQIINDILTVLALDSNKICKKSVLEKVIFEPIMLGLWNADVNTHKFGEQFELTNNYSIIKNNIDKIDQEFEINKLYKIKEIKKHITGLSRVNKNSEEKSVPNAYIAQYIDSFLQPDEFPYDGIKYK